MHIFTEPINVRDCQIADFGFAASGLRGTMCHSIVGSRTYMAPEVISPQVDDYGREVGYDPTKVGGPRIGDAHDNDGDGDGDDAAAHDGDDGGGDGDDWA